MEQIKTNVRKWGNSYGIVIPKQIVEQENLKEGVEINVTFEPKRAMKVKEVFALAKKYPLQKQKKSTEEIMKEIDKELWGIKR